MECVKEGKTPQEHMEGDLFYVHDREVPMGCLSWGGGVLCLALGAAILAVSPSKLPLFILVVLVLLCYDYWRTRANRDLLISVGERGFRISYGGGIMPKEWVFDWNDFDSYGSGNGGIRLHFKNAYIPRPPIATATDMWAKAPLYIGDIFIHNDFKTGRSGGSYLCIPHLSPDNLLGFTNLLERIGVEDRKQDVRARTQT